MFNQEWFNIMAEVGQKGQEEANELFSVES
jgi:hypothetical protein